jgi:hypothetical protein
VSKTVNSADRPGRIWRVLVQLEWPSVSQLRVLSGVFFLARSGYGFGGRERIRYVRGGCTLLKGKGGNLLVFRSDAVLHLADNLAQQYRSCDLERKAVLLAPCGASVTASVIEIPSQWGSESKTAPAVTEAAKENKTCPAADAQKQVNGRK